MANTPNSVAQTSLSRVFLIEGGARGDHQPDYQSGLALGALSQSFGDITRIEVPNPDRYDSFIEVGTIRGTEERATTSLTGRYALDLKSELLRLAQKKCSVDVHLHLGACQNPRTFNKFDKAIILRNATLTNWESDELGAIESAGRNPINETANISAEEIFEVVQLTLSQKATDLTTQEILDVIIADSISCGDCDDESDGCQKIYALSADAGGSPSTPADIVFSLDGGVTWYAHDVDGLAGTEPDALAKVGDYIVVVSNADGGARYALASEFTATDDPVFSAVTTGIVTSGEPNDIWSVGNKGFVVGDNGYVYTFSDDPSAGFSVVDAGVQTASPLNSVHALNDELAVAAGNDGVILKSVNGTSFSLATFPFGVGGGNINTIWMITEDIWWIGTSNGTIYYTTDAGVTWTLKGFPGSGSGAVHDIAFANENVGYLVHTTSGTVGRILRTYDGGYSWQVLPEGVGTFDADTLLAVAACQNNPNLAVAGGHDADGSTGALVLASA